MLKVTFFSLQYMGSFPVAIPDIASRAEYVRSQLETLRVSTFSDKNFLKVFCDSFREINLDVYIYICTYISRMKFLRIIIIILLQEWNLKYVRINKINSKIV